MARADSSCDWPTLLETRPNHLAKVSAAEKGQDEHACHIAVFHVEGVRHHIKENQDLDQQRRAADQLDVEVAKAAQRQQPRAPGQRKHQSDERAEQQRHQGDGDRHQPAREQGPAVPTDGRPIPLVSQPVE